ncbi:MAG TPA: hypothetical protein VFP71_12290 [Candidatus Angelobacter sp.]|nr:hypothetical protein [Candidatus Angelobacter sp.]
MKRPASVSIKQLSSAVEKAVSAVKQQQGLQLGQGLHFGPIIMGIILQPAQLPAEKLEKIAADLTGHLKPALGGATLEPGVLIANGRIICGFIAPELELSE